VNQTVFIYNQNGKLIDEIKGIPNDYQFVGEDLYILSQTNPGMISKVDLNHASEYLPKEHIYMQGGEFQSYIDGNVVYKYNLHTYPVYINYLIIIYFASLLMVRLEYNDYKKMDHRDKSLK
jgi:hypothetical protein